MRSATLAWAYKAGYEAAKRGELITSNPYDTAQHANKYAWLGGYNDHLSGYDLDLSVF